MADPSIPGLRLKAYGIAAIVFALDRFTKWLVETNVSVMDTYHVIPGFFDIVHSENRGVAFGILNDSTNEWRTTILVVLAAATLVFVILVIMAAAAVVVVFKIGFLGNASQLKGFAQIF